MRRTRTTLLVAAVAATATLGVTAATAGPGAPARVPTGFTEDRSADLAAAIDPAKPRNVILIIGDGMDDSMITAARNYQYGAGGRFPALDSLPFTGAMTTYGLKAGAGPDYPIAYVSDSAPTASGWSTGKKTIDGRLSQGPSALATTPGENYKTVLEHYQEQGKLVGDVSTAELTDATPAAAASHISQRACQGPTDMTVCAVEKKSAGGLGSVAEQLVDHEIDVLLGGGKNRFAQATDAGPTVLADAATKGYRLVEDKAALDAVTSLEAGPVLGLFTGGNMTPRFNPLVATPPPGSGGPTTKCTDADRGNQPDLSTMTAKAIDLLDNDKGFFLQSESAMIDKQEHSSDICGAIGDLVELDETVQVALDYQADHPDTLVIVTGDHAHSTQIVANPADDGRQTATVQTVDGDPMSVAYSTNAVGSDHTGTQIRVAASGPQAANVTGVIDQTDLFGTLLGREPSTLPGPGEPTPLEPAVQVASLGSVPAASLKKRGLPISVAAAGATKVTVTLRNKGKLILTKVLPSRGGDTRLRTARKVTGPLVVKVTVTGPGGSATDSRTVRTTR
ncbi:alkaline phosphatase [Nocardioides sp.]|uniref:alkaline phosphatase n=1 Tax=Nocardioides sp. TaxID=35761 RepID=UPI00271D74BA|nr:alkaline phosphatase [Nocardioides sp.]MDO9457417.1 alkaline phosphatase [Nocardioides sp.]